MQKQERVKVAERDWGEKEEARGASGGQIGGRGDVWLRHTYRHTQAHTCKYPTETKCYGSCCSEPLVPHNGITLARRSMVLVSDEFEGSSSAVFVSNGIGLFSLRAPCLANGLAQKETDLYLEWKPVFGETQRSLIKSPFMIQSSGVGENLPAMNNTGPYESHQD